MRGELASRDELGCRARAARQRPAPRGDDRRPDEVEQGERARERAEQQGDPHRRAEQLRDDREVRHDQHDGHDQHPADHERGGARRGSGTARAHSERGDGDPPQARGRARRTDHDDAGEHAESEQRVDRDGGDADGPAEERQKPHERQERRVDRDSRDGADGGHGRRLEHGERPQFARARAQQPQGREPVVAAPTREAGGGGRRA